jgi:hypothetical protein
MEGFVAWGHLGEHFIGIQGDKFDALQEEIWTCIKLLRSNSLIEAPYLIKFNRKYVSPTLLRNAKAFPGAFKQVMKSSGNEVVEDESRCLLMADWSEGNVLLPKADLKPELVTVAIPVLAKWVEDAQMAGLWRSTPKAEAVAAAISRASGPA